MNRIKPEIQVKKFSWENKKINFCDKKNCHLEGKYKAPKSVMNLRDYYLFCLDHVKEYNKSWDYYKGMTVNQIESSLRQDVIWNRPSWPTKGSANYIMSQINEIIDNKTNFLNNKKDEHYVKNDLLFNNLTLEEQKCVKKLNIKLPITLEKIKSSYKKLVKKYHPDVNQNDISAEKNFKEVNSAYKVLLKIILKK